VKFLALILSASTALAQYGTGMSADALNNTRVGGPWDCVVSYGFKATHSGLLASVRPYVIWSTNSEGYNGGNGGSLRFEIQTDNAGLPSGTVLASYTLNDPMSGSNFPLIPLSAVLTAGRVYHVVITNADADTRTNFVSVNALWKPEKPSPKQPRYADGDWFQLLKVGSGPWRAVEDGAESYTPIMELRYVDGFSEGVGYIEVWSESPKSISGNQSVRETFKASRNVTASAVTVRVRRVSGSGALTVRLETSGGSLIASGTVTCGTSYAWCKVPMNATLRKGTGYNLTLKSGSGTVYDTFPIRDGSAYGFSTHFSDGYAQFTTNGKTWAGWDMWGASNRKDADLQFYFTEGVATTKHTKRLTDK